jgi:hypothetical protein
MQHLLRFGGRIDRYYTLLFDVAWESEPFDLEVWWAQYALQRYGIASSKAVAAWAILAETVYGTTQQPKSMYGDKARANSFVPRFFRYFHSTSVRR